MSCGAGILDHGDLVGRAGSIQAAINLEIADPKLTHFNIKVGRQNYSLFDRGILQPEWLTMLDIRVPIRILKSSNIGPG